MTKFRLIKVKKVIQNSKPKMWVMVEMKRKASRILI